MTTPAASNFKVTYSSPLSDLTGFHREFDAALAAVKARIGQDYPLYIDGKPVTSTLAPLVDVSPIDTSVVLGRFASASPDHVDQAVLAARRAQKAWGALKWQDRLAVMRKAAAIIRERKWEIGAIMSLEVGKNRMEAMGDADESADLIDYYCLQVEEANGYE